MKKFWIVWKQDNFPTKVIHDLKSDALIECDRLATKHPDATFYVLEAVSYSAGSVVISGGEL